MSGKKIHQGNPTNILLVVSPCRSRFHSGSVKTVRTVGHVDAWGNRTHGMEDGRVGITAKIGFACLRTIGGLTDGIYMRTE
jgi:hypothetical protein